MPSPDTRLFGHAGKARLLLTRLLIGSLVVVLGLALYFSLDPAALAALLKAAPVPGVVTIPTPGPTPPLPAITASPGSLPDGYPAYTGKTAGGLISCGFLLDLGDSVAPAAAQVGVTAAHSSPAGGSAEFFTPGGTRAAVLTRQIARGQTFVGDRLSLDYVLWAVGSAADTARFLLPDPRPLAQPGELVYLYAPVEAGAEGPLRRAGVVISAAPDAVWVQLEDSFSPAGYSGCPVVSRFTGKLIGMAVAGADLSLETGGSTVVIGLHPAASLVEKASAALP